MSRPARTAAGAIAVLALTVTMSACGSDDDGGGAFSSSPPTSATSAVPSTSLSTTDGSSGSSADPGASTELEGALITVSDVGTGYTQTTSDTTESALPCTPSAPPIFQQAPPTEKVKRGFVNGAQTVQVGQTVAKFGDDSGATKAYQVGVTGFTCSTGTLGGQQVRIVKRAGGSPAGSGVDEFAAWDFAAGDVKGTAVIVRIGDTIDALTFTASGTAGNDVPVGEIVDASIRKVMAND